MARLFPRSLSSLRQLPGRLSNLVQARRPSNLSRSASAPKLKLSTSREKEGVIKGLVEKSYLPAALKLQKLRQLAASGKVLTPEERRRFLELSAAGKRLESSERIKQFDEELLKTMHQATADQPGQSPLRYSYRRSGKEHEQARALYRQVEKTATEERRRAAEERQGQALTELAARRQRLAGLMGRLRPATPPNTPAKQPTNLPPPAWRPSTAEPTPLSKTAPSRPPSLVQFAPGGAAEDVIPQSAPGQPRIEPPSRPAEHSVPRSTFDASKSESPLPSDVHVTDTSHVSDPFGGSAEEG